MKNKIGNLANYSAAAILLCFGLVYLLRNQFMPYHSEALMLPWDKVDPASRHLFLALMRATSGGFLCLAVTIAFLQYKFSAGSVTWIPGLILAIGTLSVLCTSYATLIVLINTPGTPPVADAAIGELLLITGFIFNRRYLRQRNS